MVITILALAILVLATLALPAASLTVSDRQHGSQLTDVSLSGM